MTVFRMEEKKKIPGKENFHANRSYYPSTNLKINIT